MQGAEAVVTFAVTAAAMPVAIRLLERRGVLDTPNDRSSHVAPVVRGSGLVPLCAASLAVLFSSRASADARFALIVAALAFAAIGLADDMRGDIPASRRLVLQFGAAILALPWLLAELKPGAWMPVVAAIIALWAVSYVNGFNFMDGINGISGAQAVIAGVAWTIAGREYHVDALVLGGSVIAAASAAWLPFNFPRPHAFLGDVGSYGFGAWLAILAVLGIGAGVPPEAIVAPLAVYLADTSTAIVHRAARRERLFEAHRGHVYQRLTPANGTHIPTTMLVAVVIALCSVLGLAADSGGIELRIGCDAAIAALITGYLLAPRFFRRAAVDKLDRRDEAHGQRPSHALGEAPGFAE